METDGNRTEANSINKIIVLFILEHDHKYSKTVHERLYVLHSESPRLNRIINPTAPNDIKQWKSPAH